MAGAEAAPWTVGFLTVVEHEQFGLFGGYLILSSAGRPLEFHCTTPIKPNRAQQILYGPTLVPYLYGEQIGRALVQKASTQPAAICVDQAGALAVQSFTTTPVAWVLNEPVTTGATTDGTVHPGTTSSTTADALSTLTTDSLAHGGQSLQIFVHQGHRLAVRRDRSLTETELAGRLAGAGDGFDLAEPFQRIRDAIHEAQQAAR